MAPATWLDDAVGTSSLGASFKHAKWKSVINSLVLEVNLGLPGR